jgi:hypothetical protein
MKVLAFAGHFLLAAALLLPALLTVLIDRRLRRKP